MADNFNHARDLYLWNERLFSVLGVWPLKSSYVTFTACFAYLVLHMSMELFDLYHIFDNLELVISNLSETGLETMILVKMLLLRFSKRLKRLMAEIIDGVSADQFDNDEERKIYLSYNRIAKTFFKLWVIMGACTTTVHYFRPLETRLRAVLTNESIPYVLPYRARPYFFDVNEPTVFYLAWLYQFPMWYIHAWHATTVGYVFNLILHVCGQLAVLAFRIKNLEVGSRDNPRECRLIFQDIFEKHRKAMGVARGIDDLFNLLLLEELLVTTMVLSLTLYSVLLNSDLENKTMFLTFLLFGSTMLMLIYGYCVAGEYLITESTNVYEAFYQCKWYDLSNGFKKQLIICMIGASKPLQLTGGRFYIFSLESFTSVVKSAMGYISMLRTMI